VTRVPSLTSLREDPPSGPSAEYSNEYGIIGSPASGSGAGAGGGSTNPERDPSSSGSCCLS